jgi:hypothetical protein
METVHGQFVSIATPVERNGKSVKYVRNPNA